MSDYYVIDMGQRLIVMKAVYRSGRLKATADAMLSALGRALQESGADFELPQNIDPKIKVSGHNDASTILRNKIASLDPDSADRSEIMTYFVRAYPKASGAYSYRVGYATISKDENGDLRYNMTSDSPYVFLDFALMLTER